MLAQQWVAVAPWVRTFASMAHREKLFNYGPVLATWGTAAGIAALFLLEPAPIAQADIFAQLPVVGKHWQAKLDAREFKE
ncbi:hypothetical protein HKX48_005949 [Thoreauomyces humboldtii]|nr:hypothetical protein HKX48_005949 [Thoreauomyces humboldtii]